MINRNSGTAPPPHAWADFHVHTSFCDGAHTPREIVLAAIEQRRCAVGFSVHSYTAFDRSYCIGMDRIADYKREIDELKREFGDKLRIFCGVELDAESDMTAEGFDYIIGSVHYLRTEQGYIPIDESKDILLKAVDNCFGGDIYALICAYYQAVGDVARRTRADIIGHLDLITKFNENQALFNENDPRYIAGWKNAVDRLMLSGALIEVNTGVMSRAYKSSPYPSNEILRYIYSSGGEVMLCGDSHSKDTLCYAFDTVAPKLTALGFNPQATQDKFIDMLTKRQL